MASSTLNNPLKDRIVETLSGRHMRILLDVFEDSTKPAAHYFGSNPPNPTNLNQLATGLATNHPDKITEFLNLRENEFNPNEIETNTAVEYVVDSTSLDRRLVEGAREDFTTFLSLIYYEMYDTDQGELSNEYGSLIAHATLFKSNNETIYYYDSPLPLSQVETNVKSYIRQSNRGDDRPRTVRKYEADDAVVLKAFVETSETRRAVFKCREEGTQPSRNPQITHEPAFNVKTIRVKAENLDNRAKITLSKSTNGWETDLEELFEHVFAISGGLDALTRKELEGATQILDTAKEAAKADGKNRSEVTNSIHTEIDSLKDATLDRLENEEGISDDELDRARTRYEEIEFIGVQVHSDEDTNMAEFVLRATDEFEDVTDEVDDLNAGITGLLAKANEANVRLIFRTTDIDGLTQEEFEVYRGNWTARGRGVPSEAIEMLDELFHTTTDSDE